MYHAWLAATFAFVIFSASEPANACMAEAPLLLRDVKYADVVVIGRIENYQIIRDQEGRKKLPWLSESDALILTDYARFNVHVDEVLFGEAPKMLTVTWDNSTFEEPKSMPPGPYLLALRHPQSDLPPLRGPSATIMPNKEPQALTVLQAPCAPAFIIKSGSKDALAVRKILNRAK